MNERIAATRGSSALRTAVPLGASPRTSSPLVLEMAARDPNSPRWAWPTLSTTAMSGVTRPVSAAMSPTCRAPISRTRYRVAASARSMVSGTPSSLLSEPSVAVVGAASESTAASRSLVPVLPWEPVSPTTVSPSRSRATTWAASACTAAWTSSPTTVGSAVGLEPSAATAPLRPAWPAWSWPSVCSPAKARKRPPGSASRPSSTAGAVTVTVGVPSRSPSILPVPPTAPPPMTLPWTTAAISWRLRGIMRPVKGARCIAGVSKTAYAGATPGSLEFDA